MTPADQHHLRTLIALAIAKIPPATRLTCAAKRPKVDWTAWEAAKMAMAEAIAAEIAQHFDIAGKPFGRHLAPAPTGGLMPTGGKLEP